MPWLSSLPRCQRYPPLGGKDPIPSCQPSRGDRAPEPPDRKAGSEPPNRKVMIKCSLLSQREKISSVSWYPLPMLRPLRDKPTAMVNVGLIWIALVALWNLHIPRGHTLCNWGQRSRSILFNCRLSPRLSLLYAFSRSIRVCYGLGKRFLDRILCYQIVRANFF